MTRFSLAVAASALLTLAACADNTSRPTDTGSMQAPVPQRAGLANPTTQSRDVGSMQAPTATGGIQIQPSTQPDTGNMAEPPRAQGNSLPRRVTP